MVEQFWWNSGTVMLEQCRWNNVGGTLRWKSGTVWWNSGTVLEEQWNSDSGTVGWKVEQFWLNSETVIVEAWKSDSGTVWVEQCGGTVLVEQ